jgi:hypothetical protein
MFNLELRHGESFPISTQDQLDIYELYTILKRRGRLETERLAAHLEVSRKIREVARMLDMEQRIADRRTLRRGENGLR